MYNENNFSVKNIIIQFLFVALFIFILIWLFPLKSDIKNVSKLDSSNNQDDLSVFYDRIFNENVISMKESAKSYFTIPRLPVNVGDKKKITLKEMLDLKIILPFKDKNNDTCDLDNSYVEVTKYDEEYVMKVNLKCGEEENYLLVHMGCYDYCSTTICEKNKSDIKTPVIYNAKPQKEVSSSSKTTIYSSKKPTTKTIKPTTTTTAKPTTTTTKPTTTTTTTTTIEKEYLYEYVKTTDGYYKESDWSDWQTTKVVASSTVSVKTKTVETKKLIGYNITKTVDKNQPIYDYKMVNTGTEQIKVCNKYDYVSSSNTVVNNDWIYEGLVTLYYVPTSTSLVKYEYVKSADESCSSNCSSAVGRIYRKYSKSTTDLTKYTCVDSSIKTVQLSTEVKTITGYKTVETKEPVYQTTTSTYYSYKTRTWVPGTKNIVWSKYNDTTLLNNGYKYTSNKKEK